MRVLFVGNVPPPSNPFARALAVGAAEQLERGAHVDVLSDDDRAAAHLHASLSGLRLAVHLAVRARRYDALVLRLERGLPLDERARGLRRALVLLGLGAALVLWHDVTLRLDSPIPIPGGVGGRATTLLWRNVDRVIVASDPDRAELLALDRGDRLVIDVEPSTTVPPRSLDALASQLGTDVDRVQALTLVRAQAAADRMALGARRMLGDAEDPGDSAVFTGIGRARLSSSGLFQIVLERLAARARAARAR